MQLAHVDVGAAARAGDPALVFIHGFTCTHDDFAPQIAALESSWRCIAVDLPGHGASPAVAAPSVAACADAVNATLDALGLDAVVLIGHSMGCRVACEANRRSPKRVRGVVCIDGSRVLGEGVVERLAGRTTTPADMTRFLEGFYADFWVDSSPAALRAAVDARRPGLDFAAARALLLDFVRWDQADVIPALQSVCAPMLVLQTTALDAAMKRVPIPAGLETPWMAAIRVQVRDARFTGIADVGHFPMLEAPEATTKALKAFLATL